MTWGKDWRGSRAAILFFEKGGPAFVVILTFIHCSDGREHTKMDVHIKPVLDSTRWPSSTEVQQVQLHRILVEDLTIGQELQTSGAQKTLSLGGRILTLRLKRELIFDEDTFVLDLLLSGIKRGSSETIPESHPKRSKGSETEAD
jgi:hypothetical protein